MLQKGSKGSAVKVWQLIAGAAVDGDFGNNTRNATLAFQQKAGLAADGIVGRDTWTAGLNSLQ
jgi:peptidoglycan hydrolase-like protein with peptidoglycan-binding domain